MTDFSAEAEARYVEACARRSAIAAMWVEEGEPLLSAGSTGQLVEHPLVKMLREHDALVDKLGAGLKRRHSGPAPSAVLGVRKSPAAKLRRVPDAVNPAFGSELREILDEKAS